ncbi:MAG: UDP-N-acetylmuramoyl-L-alanyl-D-glutamate--2,6-diaminopimelate ligase [Rhodoferax sp.]|nr:UDP-N-acetylmuramoyl-L-alanyl-D-glutamate--2,6-diaminopimelate ligase [Rhodoferax sp.]
MMKLTTPSIAAQWLRGRVTGTLQTDSRKIRSGDGFIAWPGAAADGRHHVADALARGAQACLVEHFGVQAFGFEDTRVASYPQLKAASGPIAAAYFDEPARQLDVLAVTGTNGKTSTAWWLAQALSGIEGVEKRPCAMVGTLGVGRPPAIGTEFGALEPQAGIAATGLTTPDPVLLQQKFREFLDQGLVACAMEASSIGIEERRLDGTPIRTAIFTNFTQDHLDYHGTMAAYWQAKASLFRWVGLESAVVNVDDPRGDALASSLKGVIPDVWTVSCVTDARLKASDIAYGEQGLSFAVTEGNEKHLLQTRLIGQYNVSNLLGVMAAMRSLGVSLKSVIQVCHKLTPVPGRMECFGGSGQPMVVVDYAHTPDALDKALEALRPLAAQRGGLIWCVFGCGGDRDPGKRPLMGAVAAKIADHVIVTSDNPRGENPRAIIDQILPGLLHHSRVIAQEDRALAVAQTITQAVAHDVVLVAGKGHEDYQEVAGVKRPFSDIDHVKRALSAWPSPSLHVAEVA